MSSEAVAPYTTISIIFPYRVVATYSDNFDQLASNDGLSGSVVQDSEPTDHITRVLGSVLICVSNYYQVFQNPGKLTSMAFLRADCSQA